MKPILTAREHYDKLVEYGTFSNEPPFMKEYMARWDGPLFWNAMGDLRGKDVLEVGIGCGRIARQTLDSGCRSLTGLDVSPRSVEAARSNLSEFSNLDILVTDIADFCKPASFHVACSVLTFMHVEDKQRALENIIESLHPGGHIVLSIDNASDSLDCGRWSITLHPWAPERYADALCSLGCDVDKLIPLIDTWAGPQGEKMEEYGKQMATVIRATKT